MYLLRALSMVWYTFTRSFTSKKPLLSTTTREIFLLFREVDYDIIISTNRMFAAIPLTKE